MSEKNNIKIKIFGGFFWKFGERITAQLVSLIVSIVLARLLSPGDYGAVSLILVFITIANVFVSNGFGSALVQKKDADEVDFSSVFYINILLSFILYAIVFFVAPFIAQFYAIPIISPALRVLGIRIIFAAINTIQQAYVTRNMLFRKFFWSTLIGTLFSGVVGVCLAYKGYGAWALVIQYLLNTCVDTLVLWIIVRWRPICAFSWKKARQLISFGWKILISGLLDTGYLQMRNLLIGKVYTTEDLAYYNQGDKYSAFIIRNINTSIGSILLPVMANEQDDVERVKQMTRRSIQISSFFIWPMMIGMAVLSKDFVGVVLTEKWYPCVPYLRVLCVAYALWPIHTANLQAINALGRSDVFLKLEIIKKIVSISIIIVSLQFGPFAIAVGVLVDGIIGTFINSFPNRKLINYTYFEQMRDICPSILLSGLMGGIISLLVNISDVRWIVMSVQVLIGGITYFGLAALFKVDILYYLIHFIREDKKNE